MPTDCPQRDERLGWAGDAEVFWRAASYNMDLTQFSKKFAADLRGTQVGTPMYGIYAPGTSASNSGHGAGWSDAGVIVPWTSWLQSGDTRIIEQNWEAMTKYLAAIEQSNPDYLWKDSGIPFGDWLSPEGADQGAAGADRVLGLRRDADAADGACARQIGGGAEVCRAVCENPDCVCKTVCAAGWIDSGRG